MPPFAPDKKGHFFPLEGEEAPLHNLRHPLPQEHPENSLPRRESWKVHRYRYFPPALPHLPLPSEVPFQRDKDCLQLGQWSRFPVLPRFFDAMRFLFDTGFRHECGDAESSPSHPKFPESRSVRKPPSLPLLFSIIDKFPPWKSTESLNPLSLYKIPLCRSCQKH